MNELQHHGVKGMKWGVRRYQKKDGTLTPAGKKRYSDSVSEAKANLKNARKEYSNAINKAGAHRLRAFHPSKSERDANTKRWENVADKGEALRAAKTEYKNAKKQYRLDNPESARTRRLNSAVERQKAVVESWKDTSAITDKKGRTIYSKSEVEDIYIAAQDKLKKLEYKQVISQKRDTINAGASAVERIWNKLTDADKYQAEIEYDIEKRAKVNKAWRD